MKIDFLDEVSSHDKCDLIPKETLHILSTPFLIILSFHQTRSEPIVYIDRKQKRKRPISLQKIKKHLVWQPLREEVNSGDFLDYRWGALWVWNYTDIIHTSSTMLWWAEKERKKDRKNWLKPHSSDVCDDLSENSVISGDTLHQQSKHSTGGCSCVPLDGWMAAKYLLFYPVPFYMSPGTADRLLLISHITCLDWTLPWEEQR